MLKENLQNCLLNQKFRERQFLQKTLLDIKENLKENVYSILFGIKFNQSIV